MQYTVSCSHTTWRYPSGDKTSAHFNWDLRAKYVDDLTIVEIIQRYSFSLLPIKLIAEHGMQLNGPECKDKLCLLSSSGTCPFQQPPYSSMACP